MQGFFVFSFLGETVCNERDTTKYTIIDTTAKVQIHHNEYFAAIFTSPKKHPKPCHCISTINYKMYLNLSILPLLSKNLHWDKLNFAYPSASNYGQILPTHYIHPKKVIRPLSFQQKKIIFWVTN